MSINVSIIINDNTNQGEPPSSENIDDFQIEYIYGIDFQSGLNEAKGEFVLFLDHHDDILINALKKMYLKATQFDSDIVVGCSFRTDIGKKWNEKRIFNKPLDITDLSETPSLIYDTILSNKIFKRTFILENQLITELSDKKYVEQLFVTKAYALSNKITIINEIVCNWNLKRVVKGPRKNRLTLENFLSRMEVNYTIDEFLTDLNLTKVKYVKDEKVLRRDFLVYINDTLYGDSEYQNTIFTAINKYISSFDINLFKNLRAIDRLKYYLLKRELFDELLYLLRYQKEMFSLSGIFLDGKVYSDLPFFLDSRYNIPDWVFEITEELTVFNELDKVTYLNGILKIKGLAFINFVDMSDSRLVQKTLILKHTDSNKEYRFELNNINRDEDVVSKGLGLYYYTYAGFETDINLSEIENEIFNNGIWDVQILLNVNGINKYAYLFSIYGHLKTSDVDYMNAFIIDMDKRENPHLYEYSYEPNSFLIKQDIEDDYKLILDGTSSIDVEDIDEDTYILRNLLITNKVNNTIQRVGLSAPIDHKYIYKKTNSGLIVKSQIDFSSLINLENEKSDSGIWEFTVTTREADGFEKATRLINTIEDEQYVISNNLFSIQPNNDTNKNLKLNVFFYKEKVKKKDDIQKLYKQLIKKEEIEKRYKQLNKKMKYIESSLSWKLTKPLRSLRTRFKKIF